MLLTGYDDECFSVNYSSDIIALKLQLDDCHAFPFKLYKLCIYGHYQKHFFDKKKQDAAVQQNTRETRINSVTLHIQPQLSLQCS